MAPALDYPLDARSPFGLVELERLGRAAGFSQTSQLVQVGAGEGGVHLAARLGCRVLVLDEEASVLAPLSDQVSARGLSHRVELRTLPLSSLKPEALFLPEASFDGVLTELRLSWPIFSAMAGLRRLLVPSGRIAMLHPVRLSKNGALRAEKYWQRRLGEPLPTPMELFQGLARAEFEALMGEVLSPADLLAFYEKHETEEAQATRDGQGCVSWMRVLGRRREPGEPPPPSRRGDR